MECFNSIGTGFNQLCRDNSIRFQEFESKKWIKSQFDQDLSQNINLGRLERVNLLQWGLPP